MCRVSVELVKGKIGLISEKEGKIGLNFHKNCRV
jgi:hypothetical protein